MWAVGTDASWNDPVVQRYDGHRWHQFDLGNRTGAVNDVWGLGRH